MLLQAPLIYITKLVDKRFDNAAIGNVFFWLVFCVLGQPMGVIMYNYDLWKISAAGSAVVAAAATVVASQVCNATTSTAVGMCGIGNGSTST